MEAEVGSTELILSVKREEHKALISENFENTFKEVIPGELKNVKAGQNQPPEIVQNTWRSEDTQKATDSEAETVNIVNAEKDEASQGECFLESPPVATAASEEICKASADHQAAETTFLEEKNMVETENQLQKVAKTVAAVEVGKVETDNVDRDPQNSETVINNLDITNVAKENKYVEKFAVMASEEARSQEIINAEVDTHGELSKNDELLDPERFLETIEPQKDKFEGCLDVISENAAAPSGKHCAESGQEEDMKEDTTTDDHCAQKGSNFPEYMKVDLQEEIEAGKVDNPQNSSELCPLDKEAAAEVQREKQNEVCEENGSTTAEEKQNRETYEVQKGIESSLNHVSEDVLPRDEVHKKANETEFEMLEKVSKVENEDSMVVKDPAENRDEAKTEEAPNTGLQEITTKGHDSEERFLEGSHAGHHTSLKHEESPPLEVETFAPSKASKENNDQTREQDIPHDGEERGVLQEDQPGDKIERSIDVAYQDETTAPTEDVGEKDSITEEGDDMADRSTINKENGLPEEVSKLPTEASSESNVTETIDTESTSKTDETEVEKFDRGHKLQEEMCESKNIEDKMETETAEESSEANLLVETRCDDIEGTDDDVPSKRSELVIEDKLTDHSQENEPIKETETSENTTSKVASVEDNAEEQTVNVTATDLSPESLKEETVGIFHDNKNNAKELNVQVDEKLEPPSISEHVEEHISEEHDNEEIFTVQTEKKTVEGIYREQEMVAEADMTQQEVHAISQSSEQGEEIEKHIEEKPTTLKENMMSVEEQTIPDSPEEEDKQAEIHEIDETAQNIKDGNAITDIPSQSAGEETTKESLIEDEIDKVVLHQEVKDLSVESTKQNLEPSKPSAAKEETTLARIDENLVDKTLVSEVPREEKGEMFEPWPTATGSNSASVGIAIEETSMKDSGKMLVDPVELEAEAEELATIAASGVKVDNEHADEQTENISEENETVIPTAGEHGIDESVEKIDQADEANQRDLATCTKPLDGNVEGITEEASAPEAKEHELRTIEASEAIDGTPAKDESPLAHEEVKVDEDNLEIKERELSETEKTRELQGISGNSDAEISKNQEALDIEIAEKAEVNKSSIEGSKGIQVLGTSTNKKEAVLKQEEPNGNFEGSTNEGVESNKAESDHSHGSEVCSTINEGNCLAEDFESANPGEKCQNACKPESENQWHNKQPETSETKLMEEKEQDTITEETMAQSTQECRTLEHEEVEPKVEAEDHSNQRDDAIDITKTSKTTEEGVEEAEASEIIKEEITEDISNDKELDAISLSNEMIKEGNNFEHEQDSNREAEESQVMQISDDHIAQKDHEIIVVVDALSSEANELENATTEEAKFCAEKLETAPANEVLKELSSQQKDLEDEPTDNNSDAKGLPSTITETDLHNEEIKTMNPEEMSDSVADNSMSECENTVQEEELGFKPTEEEKGTPEVLTKEEVKPREMSSKPESQESVSQMVNADSLSEEPDAKPTRPTEYSLQESSKSEDILEEVVKKCEEASDPDFQKNEEVFASEPSIQNEETLCTSEETEVKEEHFQAASQPAAEKHVPTKHGQASSFELEKTEITSRSMLGGQNDEALSSLEEAGDKENYLAASDLIDEENLKAERREESQEGFSHELQKTEKALNAVPEAEDKDSPARREEDETQAKSLDTAKPDSTIEENLLAEIREKEEETSTLQFETNARDFVSTAEVQSHRACSKSETTSKQDQPDAAVTKLSVEENQPPEQGVKPKEKTALQSEKPEIHRAEVQSLEAISKSETIIKEGQLDAAVPELSVEENPLQEQDEKPNVETTLQSTKTEIDAAKVQSLEALSKSETTSKEEQLDTAVTELLVEENSPQEQGDKPKEETALQSETTEIDAAEVQSLEALSKSETTSKEELDVAITEFPVEEYSLQEQGEKLKEETTLPLEKTEIDAAEDQNHEALAESETTSNEEQLDAGATELPVGPPQVQGEKPKDETTEHLEKTKKAFEPEAPVQENAVLAETEENETEAEILRAAEIQLPVEKKLPELVEKFEGDSIKIKKEQAPAAEAHCCEATTVAKEILSRPITELKVEETFHKQHGGNSIEASNDESEKTRKSVELIPEVGSPEELTETETRGKKEQLNAATTQLPVEGNLPEEQGEEIEKESSLESGKTEQGLESETQVQKNEILEKTEANETKTETLTAAATELPVDQKLELVENIMQESIIQIKKEEAPESAAKAQYSEALTVAAETLTNEDILGAPIAEQAAEETIHEQEGGNSTEASNEKLDKTDKSFESVQSMPEVSSPEEHTESETGGKKEQLNAATIQSPVEENLLEEQGAKLEEEPSTELERTEHAFDSEARVQNNEILGDTEENKNQAEIPGAAETELPVESKILELVGKETELPVAHSCVTPKLAEENETNEETLTARTAEPTVEQNIHKTEETSNAELEKTEKAFESVPEVGRPEEVSESETGGKVEKLTAASTQLQIKENLPEEQGEKLEEESRMDLEEKAQQPLESRTKVQKNEILPETEENETWVEILGAAETELPVGKKLLELVEKAEEETSTHTKKGPAAEYATEVQSPEAPITAEEITTTKELLNAPNAEQTIEKNFPDGQGLNLDEAATNDLELEKTKKTLESQPEVQNGQIPTEQEGNEIKDRHLQVAAAELKVEENQCGKRIIVTEETKREISSKEGISESAASQDYHLVSSDEEIKEILPEDGSNAKSYLAGKSSETFIIAEGTQNEELPQNCEAGTSEQQQGSVACENPVPDSDLPETVKESVLKEAQDEQKVDDEEKNKTDCNPQTKITESEDMQPTRAGNKEDKIVDSVVPEKQIDQNIETHEEISGSSSPDADSAGNPMDDEKLNYHKDATAESISQEYQEARYANPTTSCFVKPAQVGTGIKEEHIKAEAAELKIKEDEKAFELVHEVQGNVTSSKSKESETQLKILEDVMPESANKENLLDEVAEKHEEDSNAVFEKTEASESILVVEPHEGVTESEEVKSREEHLQAAPTELAIENLPEKQGQKLDEASYVELEKNEKALDSISPDQKNELTSKSEEGEAKKELVEATSESAVQENFPDMDWKQDETSNLEPENTEKAPETMPEEKDVQELVVDRDSQQASIDQDVAESCQEDELLREDEANKETLEATNRLTAELGHHEKAFTANEEVKHEILNDEVVHKRVEAEDSQQVIMTEDIKESLQADESLREDETKEDEPLGEDEAMEKNLEAVTTDVAAEEKLFENTLMANEDEISTELAVDNMPEKQCQMCEEASYSELEISKNALDSFPTDQETEMATRSEEDGTKKELIEAASEFSIQENFLDRDGKQDEAPNLELEKTEKAPESGPEIQSLEPVCKSEEAEKGKEHLETETTELIGENLLGEQNEMSKEAFKTESEMATRSLNFVLESQNGNVLTESEDYEANERNLDTAMTDITDEENEFERTIMRKKELKNEISTEEELIVAEESQQASLDEIVKENCPEDESLRGSEAQATITTKVSAGEEIKDSHQEAMEKNLEAVITDLTAKENGSDKTSTAIEEPKNKISKEEVLQEKVDAKDSHQVSTGEVIKDSPKENEPTPANYPRDQTNTASIITDSETQVEQLAQQCEDSASQKAQGPSSNETLDIVSDRNNTAEESILEEAALEMKLNEMGTEVDVEGQIDELSSAETDTGSSIPSEEIKVPELVVLKHEWEPKESIEIEKIKNEEGVNKVLSAPPTACVVSEELLPVKQGGKGDDASESLVSEMPTGESIMTCKKSTDVTSLYSDNTGRHKDDNRLKQLEANSAQSDSTVQFDQKEHMLCTRELESSWLRETIQKGEISTGNEIIESRKEHGLVLEEHIDASILDTSAHNSLFDLMERSIREHPRETEKLTEDKGQMVCEEELHTKEGEKFHVEELLTDEEKECEEDEEEHKKADSGLDAPVMVEADRDMDEKAAHKKHHNILSGVGSKVKHSIAKVKKAITGKSSHHKQLSPK